MKGRLRWKMSPRETGLRSIGAGPRDYNYHDGETGFSTVSPIGGDWRGPLRGWFWQCPSNEAYGIEWNNTATCKPYPTPEAAKLAAENYIKAALKSWEKKTEEKP